MVVTIIGWYGTETIGDRAIFAGILKILSESLGPFTVKLGSIHAFYSRRMISEDKGLWRKLASGMLGIEVFDSKSSAALSSNIDSSDVLIMGGGPLMHIDELYLVEYAFKYAKRKGVKTAIFGCGIGPLYNPKYKKTISNILENSNLTIFRDKRSKQNFKKYVDYYPEVHYELTDPSVFILNNSCLDLASDATKEVVINVRQLPVDYMPNGYPDQITLTDRIGDIINIENDKNISLVPMNYFHVGGDDRVEMIRIRDALKNPLLNVQLEPLTLYQTMQRFASAEFCVGMRYHSVIFQTLLNGNNYILDYTDKKEGKIGGFLESLELDKYYEDRYVNLSVDCDFLKIRKNKKVSINEDFIEALFGSYVAATKKLV